ncbi:iron dicitrate transport regulator FecR [Pseudomonas sp. SDI]|uniref:FecR domain-containing protein n=1 Tax=Pseudomonas sp. SDI TaxID=2170734 RepID=UPI000DE66A04|nr:FecR family protein [Pseudomonas sp. SDI]PWB31976.1 iron dicitrate transport regulator FecR [Pseudomonas sp. SDI]
MSNDPAIAQTVLKEAASWLLLMQEGPLSPCRQNEFDRWQAQSADHQRAWKRAEQLLCRIANLPPALAKRTLNRPTASDRRAVLRGVLLLIAGAPLAWWSWRAQVWRNGFGADYITAVGEQREIVNDDGTQVTLNTDTALNVRYDALQRLLLLHRGEIYIRSATDRQSPARPLLVQTVQGVMLALGTAFSVRQLEHETLLAVYDGAVQVRPAAQEVAAGSNVIRAGQQVRFSREGLGVIEAATAAALAWRSGLLSADDLPMRLWAQELMRYGRERIECDATLQSLRVSGTFPLNDVPLAVAMLAQTHALKVHSEGRNVLISR